MTIKTISLLEAYIFYIVTVCLNMVMLDNYSVQGDPYHWQPPSSMSSFHRIFLESYTNKPKSKNLDSKKLLKRMGTDFDPTWMSVTPPKYRIANKKNDDYYTQERLLLNEISQINFTYSDEKGQLSELKDRSRKAVEKWLLQLASCPVYYMWRDMSVLFWPRWIKHGECDTARSCSWPSGMHCTAGQHKTVRLLNWKCTGRSKRKRKRLEPAMYPQPPKSATNANSNNNMTWYKPELGFNGLHVSSLISASSKNKRNHGRKKKRRKEKMRCKWVKTRYPLTTSCYCGC